LRHHQSADRREAGAETHGDGNVSRSLAPRAAAGDKSEAIAEAAVAKFKAIVVEKADKGQTVSLTEFDEADLMDGDVTVRIGWSTINYKDAPGRHRTGPPGRC